MVTSYYDLDLCPLGGRYCYLYRLIGCGRSLPGLDLRSWNFGTIFKVQRCNNSLRPIYLAPRHRPLQIRSIYSSRKFTRPLSFSASLTRSEWSIRSCLWPGRYRLGTDSRVPQSFLICKPQCTLRSAAAAAPAPVDAGSDTRRMARLLYTSHDSGGPPSPAASPEIGATSCLELWVSDSDTLGRFY